MILYRKDQIGLSSDVDHWELEFGFVIHFLPVLVATRVVDRFGAFTETTSTPWGGADILFTYIYHNL